ncbi:hypothetical protein FO519_008919 [Halicephalobus sp. NKZ332]|nr:hypothetical protein FO519_008919 [Halicephalobus sp. NKZ332]
MTELSSEESFGILIAAIKNASSTSADQQEFQKKKLKEGFENSAKRVDELLSRHQKDVSNSLKTFRAVSSEITACRQRINSVKNALAASKVLLHCRREDLKKLWIENVEQKCVCNILQQIEEIKQMDFVFKEAISIGKYRSGVEVLKKADIILNGPLSAVEGLDQLRTHVVELTGVLFENIVHELLELLAVRPFDSQMLELIKGMNVDTLNESVLCIRLTEKYKDIEASLSSTLLSSSQFSPIASRIAECLESLAVFDQLMNALDQVFNRSKTIYMKAISDTVSLLRLLMKEPVADSSHLAQLIQIVVLQIKKAHEAHQILASELSKVGRYEKDINVEKRFWEAVQEVLQTVVMKHLDIYEPDSEAYGAGESTKIRSLFRFDGTNCVSSYSSRLTAQPIQTICKPEPYNIIPIFRVLNDMEQRYGLTKFSNFLHTFVMSTFIQRVCDDTKMKTQTTISRGDVWSALSSTAAHNVKLLTSCLAIFEECKQVGNLISNMEQYALQFAQIWLEIISSYASSASETYSNITKLRSATDDGSIVEHRKISAAWAADEDISRTLRNLPQWILLNQASVPLLSFDPDATPTGKMTSIVNDSDKEIKKRTEREAEILIDNLGKTKSIDRNELITDMESFRSLICMHESLQWFVTKMKQMISDVPKRAKEILRTSSISKLGGGEQNLLDALNIELNRLEELSEIGLLMIHLELRVHCFYYLLPLAQFKSSQPHDDIDKGVVEFGQDMVRINQLLNNYILPQKVRHLFEGLGYLCASIFIHSSQHMTKLTESNKKRVIRNIVGVQQHLCRLTGRRESELDRAKTFFDLLNKDPDQLLAMIMERGATFTFQEYTYLIALAVRSDHSLSAQPGALDAKINQLRSILSQ